ncbi:MAG: transporter, partial [Gemmatimonadetes bacterium]|nr:transporter [Gemmatimonadota bacterium]
DDATLSGGITYLVSKDFQLDARIGAGLTDDAPDVFVGFGVARRW